MLDGFRYVRLVRGPLTAYSTEKPIDIEIGHDTACILMDTGRLLCWGKSPGLGGGTSRWPQQLGQTAYDSSDPVVKVVLNSFSNCYITFHGNLHCWAGGSSLSPSTNRYSTTNVSLPSGLSAVDVAISDQEMCVLFDDGSISCIGSNSYGQLGDGSTTDRSSFTSYINLQNQNFSSIGTISDRRYCAIQADDANVHCWEKCLQWSREL